MQRYYALVTAGRYAEARRLWTQEGQGSGLDADAFAASFAPYARYAAVIGEPGSTEGAAGSLFLTIPVRIDAQMRSGQEVSLVGEVTLRRVNDVPGSTLEQRSWRIFRIDLRPQSG